MAERGRALKKERAGETEGRKRNRKSRRGRGKEKKEQGRQREEKKEQERQKEGNRKGREKEKRREEKEEKDRMILERLARASRARVEKKKAEYPLERIRGDAFAAAAQERGGDKTGAPAFERALTGKGISFICEVKRASPSKGIIAAEFPYREIAAEYEAAGAAALSVLTEPEYFLGNDRYLREIAAKSRLPVLRKDFTVDEYQIYEAKTLGASAVLLICAILEQERLERFLKIAESVGLSALVEAHDAEEVKRAVQAGAGIIGVNNRNLRDFTVDVSNSLRLRALIPDGVICVSESGICTPEDVEALYRNKTDAVLIGEALMRSPDKKAALAKLAGRCV